jgi:excisionase family DNA binding protein
MDRQIHPDQYLTITQLAERWSVSTSWIRRAMAEEGLPFYRLGSARRLIRLRWSEVEQWLRDRPEQEGPTDARTDAPGELRRRRSR